jgi:hypothetical protein
LDGQCKCRIWNGFTYEYSFKELSHKAFAAYSFEFLKQTNGNKDWESLYNYPQVGVGVIAVDYLTNKQLGSPYAIYGIYNAKIKQWDKLKWYHSINFESLSIRLL